MPFANGKDDRLLAGLGLRQLHASPGAIESDCEQHAQRSSNQLYHCRLNCDANYDIHSDPDADVNKHVDGDVERVLFQHGHADQNKLGDGD